MAIASWYWMGCGETIRSTDPTTIITATPSRKMALVKPPRISIFQVPNAKRGSLA
ncbi:hypothetical protein D9M71_454730 [compost metagenome]